MAGGSVQIKQASEYKIILARPKMAMGYLNLDYGVAKAPTSMMHLSLKHWLLWRYKFTLGERTLLTALLPCRVSNRNGVNSKYKSIKLYLYT